MARNLTAANAVITLAITGLYSIPQTLQGFSADNVYESPAQDVAETLMGVDGILSGGFVFNPVDQVIRLQADSLSNDLFASWRAAMAQGIDVYTAEGRTTLKALGQTFVMTRGFLVSLPPMPTLNKIIQPMAYTIRWQSVQQIPLV